MTGFRVAAGGPVIPDFGQGSACLVHNHWFCKSWVAQHWGDTFQPALVQHVYEARCITFGRNIATTIQVRRRHQQKWLTFDEGPAVRIDERPVFLHNTWDRNPYDVA